MTALQQLGPVVLPQPNAGVEAQTARQTNLAETGLLETDTVSVDQLTNQAGDLSLSGRYRPPYIPQDRVQMVADEFESLSAGSMGPLALFDQASENSKQAGFYEIADGSVSPAHPSQPDVQEWSLNLTRVGSRNTHWRALRTAPIEPTNPYNNSSTVGDRLYLPTSVRKPQWYDPETGTLQRASRVFLTGGPKQIRGTGVYAYDVSDAPTDDPTLLYELEYEDDVLGVHVFERPSDRANKYDSDGARQWPAIFDTGADIDADSRFVIDTRGIKLEVSGDPTPALTAAEWDPASNAYTDVSLGKDDTWTPTDVDIAGIGQHRVVTDISFTDGSQLYTVRIRARFAADRLTLSRAPRETTAFPAGLQTLLEPLHDNTDTTAQPTRGVVAREEVR